MLGMAGLVKAKPEGRSLAIRMLNSFWTATDNFFLRKAGRKDEQITDDSPPRPVSWFALQANTPKAR